MRGGFKVEGLKGLDAALSKLPEANAKRLVTARLKKAAQPIADDASALATRRTNELATSFGVGTRLTRRQRAQHVKESDVEVFAGSGGGGGSPVQAITEEFGTSEVSPHPALRPAWDANKRGALDSIARDTWSDIERAAKRLARKAAKG